MLQKGFALITDRGGHLHNALMLLNQMRSKPAVLLSTPGPDTEALKSDKDFEKVQAFPTFFTFFGKTRFFNVFKFIWHCIYAGVLAFRYRPTVVVSLGASNVVPFCYWAKLLGARVYHVECMNQVVSPSITGRLLYPICHKLFVQWESLKSLYGPKAQYAGWVL